MASIDAIYSVGESLVSFLTDAYQLETPLGGGVVCSISLLSSEVMGVDSNNNEAPTITRPSVSLYLYRVTVNEHLRNQPPPGSALHSTPPLPLDLHYLVTIWASAVDQEHKLLGWVMQKLHQHQRLGASELSGSAGLGPSDVIHVIPAELSNEDLMRIWEALRRPYCLSISYIARSVRIDAGVSAETGAPVVARRFDIEPMGSGGQP